MALGRIESPFRKPMMLPVMQIYSPFGEAGTMEFSARSGQTRFLELDAAEAFRAMFSEDVNASSEVA